MNAALSPAAPMRFAVRGMTCASCVGHVEAAVRAVPGVVSVSVNLPLERADVVAPPEAAARIVGAIAEEGYEARLAAARGSGDTDARAAREAAEETAELRQAALLAAVLTLPVAALEMGAHLFPAFHHWQMETLGETGPRLVALVLTLAVLVGPGRRFFKAGLRSLVRLKPDMNALIALGAGAAFLYSALATLAPALFPPGLGHVYFESAAVIVTLVLVGRLIEARSRGQAGAAARALAALQPTFAIRLRGGEQAETPLDELMAGDIVLVQPGARVPADGVVVEGSSHVDESMLTGEPVPVRRAHGQPVVGGSVNGLGALTVRVTAVGEASFLAGVVRLVEEAQGARLPIQALIDTVTALFVPAVLGLALITMALWLWLGPEPGLAHALAAAASVLIIACPCAMGLATPMSVAVATGRAAELGALLRRGEALERLARVRLVAFDKTGTLTIGRPVVTRLSAAAGWEENAALALAAAAETRSEHPIGRAIVQAASERGLALQAAENVQAMGGLGLVASVGGQEIAIGSRRFMTGRGVVLPDASGGDGQVGEVHVAIAGAHAISLTFADAIKPEAREAIAALKARGLGVAMISGDDPEAAQAVAAMLGIDKVHAGLLPAGKVEALLALSAENGPVAFIGDGVNDGPALAAASVGVAMGGGTQLAAESADIILPRDDLSALVDVHALSRATMTNIRQNLAWAFGYNIALIPVAMGALYPAFGVLLSPMLAAGAMALSSVLVALNALRLTRFSGMRATRLQPAAQG
jgi:Cu+-exporting ATPase